MSIKGDLRTYYAKQGLTGQHLRQALRHDMRSIRKARQVRRESQEICSRFDWSSTKEGYNYWLERACKSGK